MLMVGVCTDLKGQRRKKMSNQIPASIQARENMSLNQDGSGRHGGWIPHDFNGMSSRNSWQIRYGVSERVNSVA